VNRAVIIAGGVAVIAFFVAFTAYSGILKNTPVSTFWATTGVGTAVIVAIIAVIAGFIAGC
jgi:hypothetical protein